MINEKKIRIYKAFVIEKAMEVNSDSQLYKQAGNAVSVNVVKEVTKNLPLAN